MVVRRAGWRASLSHIGCKFMIGGAYLASWSCVARDGARRCRTDVTHAASLIPRGRACADILLPFMFTARYIDDLFSIGNKYFTNFSHLLLYNHTHFNIYVDGQTMREIHGIYPGGADGLQITLVKADTTGPVYNHFMDISFFRRILSYCIPCTQVFHTSVYHKRDDELRILGPMVYTHAHSAGPIRTKLNVLGAQLHRVNKLCSCYSEDYIMQAFRIYRSIMGAGHDIKSVARELRTALYRAGSSKMTGKSHKRLLSDFVALADDPILEDALRC